MINIISLKYNFYRTSMFKSTKYNSRCFFPTAKNRNCLDKSVQMSRWKVDETTRSYDQNSEEVPYTWKHFILFSLPANEAHFYMMILNYPHLQIWLICQLYCIRWNLNGNDIYLFTSKSKTKKYKLTEIVPELKYSWTKTELELD